MNFYLLVLLKATALTAVAYLVYRFVLSNTGYFKINRIFLIVALVLGATLPWMSFSLPAGSTVASSVASFTLPEIQVGETSGPLAFSLNLLLFIYLLGLAFFSGLFIKDLIAIAGIIRRAEPSQLDGRQVLLSTEQPSFSFFSVLVLNNHTQLSGEDKAQILAHEEVHIQEGHSFDLIAAELLKILLWFNPFSWLLKSAVQENCEFLADKGAAHPQQAHDYAQLLLEQAIAAKQQHPILHHFNQHQIKRRVHMLVKLSAPNWRPYLIGLPLILLAAFVVSCSGIEKQSEQIVDDAQELVDAKTVDKIAEFPGGFDALVDYLGSEIKYPKSEDGPLEGAKVFVKFTVDSEGKIEGTKAVNDVHPAFAAEAVRVVSAMPNWIPAEKEGKNVKVEMTLPIVFAES